VSGTRSWPIVLLNGYAMSCATQSGMAPTTLWEHSDWTARHPHLARDSTPHRDSGDPHMKLIGKRQLAAAAATATLASLCIAGSAASASASTNVINASTGNGYPQAHQCVIIGRDWPYGNQGIVCADLYAYDTDYGPMVSGWMEAYCENSSNQIVQCAEVNEYGSLANAVNGVGARVNYHCGHSYGPCSDITVGIQPPGRNIVNVGSASIGDISATCGTDPVDNYWDVVWGQGNLTAIELPQSDSWVYLSSPAANDSGNQSSGHYQVCP
jgi:hypothetical protein